MTGWLRRRTTVEEPHVTREVPTLLLERDGYQVETVLDGPGCAWVVIHQERRWVRSVATGWAPDFRQAHRDAYDAAMAHKADVAARSAPSATVTG